ncbi:MAG: Response regulator of zinc sigma-54-dependent two-component system [Labilithrix sp.]|nr:Response regulator of zinc sigma-54-dependent two-component system [Labilithrix sp.]
MSRTAKLRAVLLEDEPPARDYLAELLTGTGHVDVTMAVATIDEAREALASESGLSTDVLFADVQLVGSASKEAGLELVRSLGADGPRVVLATAHRQYALEAWNLGLVDYLHKPFTRGRIEDCVRRLLERRPAPAATPPARILARCQRALVFLDVTEVWAFEAEERLIFVHTAEGKFDFDLPLSSVEATFPDALVRVHRNWLVNSSMVRSLEREDGETKMFVGPRFGREQPGIRVPVARERAVKVREILLTNAAGVRRS